MNIGDRVIMTKAAFDGGALEPLRKSAGRPIGVITDIEHLDNGAIGFVWVRLLWQDQARRWRPAVWKLLAPAVDNHTGRATARKP